MKKDKKKSKKSIERDNKRKQIQRLARARMLTQLSEHQNMGLGEDDLDMPEYENTIEHKNLTSTNQQQNI